MRFVFAITRLSTNGPSFSRIRLAEGLQKRGHEVTILTVFRRAEIDVPAGIHVATVDAAVDAYPHGIIGRWRLALSLRRWFAKESAARPIDFFSSSLTGTDRLVPHGRYRGCPLLDPHRDVAAPRRRAERSAEKQAARNYARLYHRQKVIGVSQGVIDDLAVIGAVPDDAVLLYNAYDVGVIRRRAEEAEPDLPNEPFLLFVGRFSGAKRLDVLFDAIRQLAAPIRLVLLTEPSAELGGLIAAHRLENRVTVAGFRSNPYPFMRAAAALVLSSDREGFPNVLVEALICGTPVISSDCPSGPSEILTGDYRRFLFPPGDAGALAERIEEVLAIPYAIEPGSTAASTSKRRSTIWRRLPNADRRRASGDSGPCSDMAVAFTSWRAAAIPFPIRMEVR